MKLCDEYCAALCDNCKFYKDRFRVKNHKTFCGEGECVKHKKIVIADEFCYDFECINFKGGKA